MDTLKRETVESAYEVFDGLIDPDNEWYTCHIKVQRRQYDSVVDDELELQLHCINDATHARVLANGDRIYTTNVRFEATGQLIAADVAISNNAATWVGAIILFDINYVDELLERTTT